MTSNNLILRSFLLFVLTLAAGCGGGSSNSTPVAPPATPTITVTPADITLTPGTTRQFTATETLTNGSTVDVTSQATWSATGGVQVSTTGLVTVPATAGATSVTITAQFNGISGSTLLTISGAATVSGGNVVAVTVNGSLCSSATSGGYFNKPCTVVTICNPDGSACQAVTDILVDTGSYGLRIFKQAIPNLNLPQVSGTGTGALAECIHFADGSTIWGPVKTAKVILGSEPAVQVPVQVIDASFATPTSCGTPDPDPATARYTGVLGIGPLTEDCGPSCANFARVGFYFSCTGSTCTGTTVSLANQVKNPISNLPADNNGLLVQLPSVPVGGVNSVNGSLVLGIGTQTNNTPTPGLNVLPLDPNAEFTTTFNGSTFISFLDTGSNALFFQDSALPVCGSFYCPPTTTPLNANLIGTGGSPVAPVSFNVSNSTALFNSGHAVFSDVAGPLGTDFDWGLPFFMGRTVFLGIDGTNSSLGAGPLEAF